MFSHSVNSIHKKVIAKGPLTNILKLKEYKNKGKKQHQSHNSTQSTKNNYYIEEKSKKNTILYSITS